MLADACSRHAASAKYLRLPWQSLPIMYPSSAKPSPSLKTRPCCHCCSIHRYDYLLGVNYCTTCLSKICTVLQCRASDFLVYMAATYSTCHNFSKPYMQQPCATVHSLCMLCKHAAAACWHALFPKMKKSIIIINADFCRAQSPGSHPQPTTFSYPSTCHLT